MYFEITIGLLSFKVRPYLSSILKVLKTVLIIVIGFQVSGLIWYLLSSYSDFLQLDHILQFKNGTRIILPFDLEVLSSRELMIAFILTIVQQGIILAILYIVSSIFETIKLSHSPFVHGIAQKMKIISLLILFANVSTPISMNISSIELSSQLKTLFSLTGVLGTFVIAGICYCFAIIFDYGCKLQQESDETL